MATGSKTRSSHTTRRGEDGRSNVRRQPDRTHKKVQRRSERTKTASGRHTPVSGASAGRRSPASRPAGSSARRPAATSFGKAGTGSGHLGQQHSRQLRQTGGQGRPAGSRPPRAGARPVRRPRRRRQLRGWVKVAIALVVILLVVRMLPFGQDSRSAAPTVSQAVNQLKSGVTSQQDEDSAAAALVSDSAILINADNGDVLYAKDPDTPRPPASLTKMMTVYVAIKNNEDPDEELKMPQAAFDALSGEESTSGLSAGETVTLRDLLYAAILPSGGDAAMALALATSGNEEAFVDLMNQQAAELDMDSTHFENPIGTDADGQLSTCRDMARLLKAAMGDSLFKEVITARTYTTTANDLHPQGVQLTHTIDDYLTQFQRFFDASDYQIIGGKTGYTENAGNCLASIAEKEDDPTCIAVTLHATEASDNYYQSVKDAVTLYDMVYAQ